MIRKSLRKEIQQLMLMSYMLNNETKYNSNHEKTSHSFNDSKRRRIAISCSKKFI